MIVQKITPQQRRRSLKLAIISSCASIIAGTCGSGNILSLAAIKLGAGDLFIGIFNFASIAPFVLGLATMSAMEKYGKTKILYPFYMLGAVFFLPLLMLPFVTQIWPAWACLCLLAGANCLRNAATALGSTGWFPMLQDIVPRRLTGRYFARLRTTWQSANCVALVTAAVILLKPSWIRFELIFMIAMICEVLKALPIRGIVENPPPAVPSGLTVWQRIKEYFADSAMSHYTVYLLFYAFASMAVEPFKVKLLSDLGYGYSFIVGATAMIGLGAIATLSLWGKLADRFGNRAIFGISHLGMIVSTVLWIFVPKSSVWGMAFVLSLYFFWSLFNCGNQLAQTNYMLRVVPANKQNFLSIIVLVQRLSTATAPLLAGLYLHFAGSFNIRIGSLFTITSYHILFLVAGLLFLVPHFMRKRLKAKTDTPTAQVISLLTRPVIESIYELAGTTKSRQNQR